eukprot:TRINITY_DN18673_c0_g1_i1.p1 TRINITY_DN18673_c0_g1~~TRINITY_DN18673_c0_g1_i1.p1  ORF type:complete len:682 (+),score=214.60 TRINITY_DN18673_c0_g1_i1:156-2201(+)
MCIRDSPPRVPLTEVCPEDSNSRRSIEEVTPQSKLQKLNERLSRNNEGHQGLTAKGFEPVLFSRDNSRMSAPGPCHDKKADSEGTQSAVAAMNGSSCAAVEASPRKKSKLNDSDLLSTNSKMSNIPAHGAPNVSPPKDRTIHNYFRGKPKAATSGRNQPEASVEPAPAVSSAAQQGALDKLRAKVAELQQLAERHQGEIASLEEDKKRAEEAHDSMMQEMQSEVTSNIQRKESRERRCREVLEDVLVERALQQRTSVREKLRRDGLRLGHITAKHHGVHMKNVWEDGQAFLDLANKLHEMQESKERAKDHQQRLKKQRRNQDSGKAQHDSVFAEITKARLQNLAKEEKSVEEEKEKLNEEKKLHIRELKRVRDEDESPFNDFRVLDKRYLLTNLLGRGGFSEVYKAFDLNEYKEVVIKLHRLHPHWSQERKMGYQKHASREYQIHATLDHPNIVRLWGVFTIDVDCFATVMEYCPGNDLDYLLQVQRQLPEKEAKLIMLQVLEGIRYLNTQKQRVIHYDLKPANILFTQDGVVKITDFGLSKIMDDDNMHDMELTSQGAGTYWYLPPECFEKGSNPPRISTKVDVWSAGVIFYQLLFGERPFGEGMQQDQIYHEGTITKAKHVEFPLKPQVSAECKDVIRRCLAHSQDLRPEITSILNDVYFKPPGKTKGMPTANGSPWGR